MNASKYNLHSFLVAIQKNVHSLSLPHLLSLAVVTGAYLICTPYNTYAFDQGFASSNNILFYDPTDTTCSASDISALGIGKDYKGRDLVSAAQLQAIKTNQPVYEQAAAKAGIPWQMLAVIHLRETGLKLYNPSNGQGIYQDYAQLNGPYPTGPVSTAEFLRQSIWAANFLASKASDPSLLKTGDIGAIKDTFYGYNGRADAYAAQAKRLGFTHDYEGSPYVMNIADAKRDPAVNPTTWGQIVTDGGALTYPANSDPGAFVVYASLTGTTSSTGCSGSGADGSNPLVGTTRQKIIQIAQQEYRAWQGGFRDYKKYTEGTSEWWCAWFASWVYQQAGVPLTSGSRSSLASVSMGLVPTAQKLGIYHPASSGYKPQPGDMVIYDGHVNILINTSPFDTIGGDEGTASTPAGNNIKENGSYWQTQTKLGYISPPGGK